MWLIDFLTAFSEIIAKVKHFSLQSTAVITKTSNSILAFQTHNLKVIRNHKFQLSWIFHRQKLDPNATVLHNFNEEKTDTTVMIKLSTIPDNLNVTKFPRTWDRDGYEYQNPQRKGLETAH